MLHLQVECTGLPVDTEGRVVPLKKRDKTYGRDGKGLLFGKHTATVWIPMHVRGNTEEGIVVKDYAVK